MSVESSDLAVREGLSLPLNRIGEIPSDVFLGCVACAPASVRERLIRVWSAQLVSPNREGFKAAA